MGILTDYQQKTGEETKQTQRQPWRPDILPAAFNCWEDYERYLDDPRRDLKSDSELWITLLRQAHLGDKKLFINLHWLRCGGALLENKNNRLKLNGRYTEKSIWTKKSEWKKDAGRLLNPHLETLRQLLKQTEKSIIGRNEK